MKSMTGFGRGSFTGENFSISVELKTVNNRFLDVHLRMLGEMSQFETAIKRQLSSRLSRGRVDVNISYERSAEVTYELNRPMIAGYLAALKEMQDEFALTGEPDLNMVARLPNVMQPKKDEIGDEFGAGVEKAVEAALDDLEKMRENEGEMLKTELLSRLGEIAAKLPLIESEAATVTEEYQTRLTKRISDILAKSGAEIEIDQARLAQEAAFLADRGDIAEEIARLKIHIEQFQNITGEEKEVGKRLDFLTQELNREANTIASKTNNMNIKEASLGIKSAIEKIREQVQNVE